MLKKTDVVVDMKSARRYSEAENCFSVLIQAEHYDEEWRRYIKRARFQIYIILQSSFIVLQINKKESRL